MNKLLLLTKSIKNKLFLKVISNREIVQVIRKKINSLKFVKKISIFM